MDLANIARSTYYYYLTKLSKSDTYEDIKNKVRDIFSKSRETYGHRRITLELHKFGFKIKVLCQLGGSKNNSKHYEIRN